MSKELFDSLLTKIGSLIKEYGVANKYATEQKQVAGDIQYSIYNFHAESGSTLYKGDVDAIEILIQAFNKQQSCTYDPKAFNSSAAENPNNASATTQDDYLKRFHSLITVLESIHRQGPNIPGIKYLIAPRYSFLQKVCENLAHTSKSLWLYEKDKILIAARAQLEEERKKSQQQHDQFTSTLASEKEQRRKEKEEKRKREYAELTAQLKQELLQALIVKTSEDKPKLIADYEAKIALLESTQKRLLDEMAAKDVHIADLTAANDTLNQSLLVRNASAAPQILTRSPVPIKSDQANSSFFPSGQNEDKEFNELQRRIGTIHAKYVRCLATFSKLADESELANKAKELLKQLLVNYEQPLIVGTTDLFKSVTLQNEANQELFNKTLEEMALLEKNDSAEKHRKTIEDFHSTEAAKIVGKPLLTPQIQLLGKIKDFVIGYDDGKSKKPASQMLGNIPSLNLTLEERLNALRNEHRKQLAQNAAASPAPAAIAKH